MPVLRSPAQRRPANPGWALALLLIAVSVPAFAQLVQALRDAGEPDLGDALSPLAFHVGMCAVLLALVGTSRRALLLLTPASLLAPLEALYIASFKQPSGSNVYGIVIDTNAAEALSWIGPWLWPSVLAALLWLALVARMTHRCWHANWHWQHRSRYWVLGAVALCLGGFAVLRTTLAPSLARLDQDLNNPYLEFSLDAPANDFLGRLEPTFPWGLPLRWIGFQEHLRALKEHRVAAANFDFGVRWRGAQPVGRQVQILVIGETGRPSRWRLFGAERDTTPALSARSNLLLFTDTVSAASATREAVPLMLTRRPPGHMLAPTTEPSLVTAFKQAGYKTYWLSTQGTAGPHETPISVLAAEAAEQHFINAVDYRSAGALDGALLPLLKEILARNEPRQLIVLHTLGSHLNYAHRYPPQFEKFRPSLQADEPPDIWRPSHVPELRNAYDNSVLYTDFVLDQAIELAAQTGAAATLLYAADHGETLFDGNCGRGGHGFDSELNYRVPMFIWTSVAWQQAHPQAQAVLKAHSSAPVSTLSIFATMNGLAGFDVALPSAHGDLSASGWTPAARELTHYGNFDRDLKGKSCASKPATDG